MRRMLRVLQLIMCVCTIVSFSACVKRLDTKFIMHPTTHDKFVKIDTDVRNVNIHYLEYPGESGDIVLIPGFGSSIFTWEAMVPKLQNIFKDHGKPAPHVWAVDMKGFGWSDKPFKARYDPFTLTEEVYAWMEKIGVNNATVVGNSLGGAIAWILALDHPEKVGRLVLIDSGGYPPDKNNFAAFAWVPFPDFWINIFFNRGLVRWGLHKAFYDEGKVTDTRIDAYFNRLQTRGGIDALVAAATSLDPKLALTYAGRIHDIKQETLIIWGRNDNWIPLKDGCRFNHDIKRSTLVVIPQCGHVPQEEKPDDVAQILYQFLAGTQQGPVGNTRED